MEIIYKNSKVNYQIIGKSKNVIVYLHGWGCNLNYFDFLTKNLNAKHILIDFPPFGKSEEPTTVLTVQDYAKMVQNILIKHKVKTFSIISHSFGTRVALYLCKFYKNNIAKLIITGGAGLKNKNKIKKLFRKLKYKVIKTFNKNALVGSSDYKNLNDVMKKTFSNIVNKDLSSLAKMVNVPTLLIYGNKDNQTPIYMAKKFNKLIKNSKLIIYKNFDHFAYIHNSKQFLLDVSIFLKE